jgi:NADH-quinone oxidoreductase subunit M
MDWLLSAIIFTPLAGAFVVLLLPKNATTLIKYTALFFAVVDFALCVILYLLFDMKNANSWQFMEQFRWIRLANNPQSNIFYRVGVDGLSMPLVVLTGLMTLISIWYSFEPIKERIKEYYAFFLLLEVGMMGTFCALDMFLFYVFWEISLVPMYFIIGIWGGPRREYAAIKFFLYTLAGSVLMLLAILTLYFYSEPHSFDLRFYLEPITRDNKVHLSYSALVLCFWAFYIAFAIKVPAFPFHTWLPDAHVEAPTAGSVILAAILLKMGTYGLIRFCLPMFPKVAHSALTTNILLTIALINIIYGALVALAQTDLKKLVAYSSIGHMGFVLLGVAAAAKAIPPGVSPQEKAIFLNAQVTALNGAVWEMLAHGLITGALFLLVGIVYERAHTRQLDQFGGLGAVVPQYAGVLVFMAMASLGLPGLAGFLGEFLTLSGGFVVFGWKGGLAVIGIVVTAAYLLWMVQRIVLGPLNEKYRNMPDLTPAEKWVALAPLVILVLLMGVYPSPILDTINQVMTQVIDLMN